jgi:hypothetical protein
MKGRVVLWDVARRRELARFSGQRGLVFAAAFSPDGKLLTTAG